MRNIVHILYFNHIRTKNCANNAVEYLNNRNIHLIVFSAFILSRDYF